MTTTAQALGDTSTYAKSENQKGDEVSSFFSARGAVIGVASVLALAVLARWYQGWASWDYGTESTSPEFSFYWMNLFYAQLILAATAFVAGIAYMWFTRDKDLTKITSKVELRRYSTFISMLVVYAFAFVFAGSFFAEQDAAWHQVVMRDTSFTPSHIVLFYGFFPLFIILGFTTYTYAMTRLPLYAKGVSIPLVLGTLGPMMVLPNVGYNEWGHAFWFMEEYFTAPLHWGFVVFGWSIMGLGGILVQLMSRISILMSDVFLPSPEPKTTAYTS
ncbi:MAG: methane monooxygenase/ammonia monooxygenase subunit C [Proteobacteria bacterium]|nr:methane monooxygenase/ammonia monooxygenase subunit C [Pseudomonadota bacterium]